MGRRTGARGARAAVLALLGSVAAGGGRTPSVLGQELEGPMDGHGPGMPRHYDKHLWLRAHNPDGAWTSWNPALSCPEA